MAGNGGPRKAEDQSCRTEADEQGANRHDLSGTPDGQGRHCDQQTVKTEVESEDPPPDLVRAEFLKPVGREGELRSSSHVGDANGEKNETRQSGHSLKWTHAVPLNLILEVSADLSERQKTLLGREIPDLVDRVTWLDRLPDEHHGVILANEVLDALPVERFARHGDEIMQICVADDDGQFGLSISGLISKKPSSGIWSGRFSDHRHPADLPITAPS